MNAGDKRMRIAMLWVTAAVTYALMMLMYLLVIPDALEEALAGQMDEMALDGFAGWWLVGEIIPVLAMAVVNLLAHNRAVQWANAVLGVVYGTFTSLELVGLLAGEGFVAVVPLYLSVAAIGFLIAGLSIGELRKPATGAAPAGEAAEHREQVTA